MTASDHARIAFAADLAARSHSGQYRKGRARHPYVNHPCAVAALVAAAGADADTIIAALLHDTVEDTEVTLEKIRGDFGDRVAALVEDLTSPAAWDDQPLEQKKRRQAEHIAGCPPAARLVKLADQISNLRDLREGLDDYPPSRSAIYLEGARAIAANCAGLSPMLDAAFEDAAARLGATLQSETRP